MILQFQQRYYWDYLPLKIDSFSSAFLGVSIASWPRRNGVVCRVKVQQIPLVALWESRGCQDDEGKNGLEETFLAERTL